MSTKVSIVIPTLNTGKLFIDDCLNSVVNQTYPNLEIILVDGHSTDGTWECICEWAEKEKRIICTQTEKGVSHQRNTGIDLATGEYICFIDSDDYIAPNYVEYMLSLMKNGIQMAIPKIAYVTYNGKENILNHIADKTVPSYTIQQDNFFVNFDTNGLVNPVKMYDRNLIGNIRFQEDLCYGEDLMFNYSLASKGYKAVFANETLYYYRRLEHNNSGEKRLSDESLRIIPILYKLSIQNKGNLANYAGVRQEFYTDFSLFYRACVKLHKTSYVISLLKYRLIYLQEHHTWHDVAYMLIPYTYWWLRETRDGVEERKKR